MEDKDLLLSRIANHQLMFGSFNTDSSIVYGRMGLVLFFFHYARYTENTVYALLVLIIPYLKILEVKYWMKSLMICIRR